MKDTIVAYISVIRIILKELQKGSNSRISNFNLRLKMTEYKQLRSKDRFVSMISTIMTVSGVLIKAKGMVKVVLS